MRARSGIREQVTGPEAVALLAFGGYKTVTTRTIRTWRDTGRLPVVARGEHGRALYDLATAWGLAEAHEPAPIKETE